MIPIAVVCECCGKSRIYRGHDQPRKYCPPCAHGAQNLAGRRFKRLLVEARLDEGSRYKPIWRCLCDCGNYTEVRATHLLTGKTKSCGCLRLDAIKDSLAVYRNRGGPTSRYNHSYQVWMATYGRAWRAGLRGSREYKKINRAKAVLRDFQSSLMETSSNES